MANAPKMLQIRPGGALNMQCCANTDEYLARTGPRKEVKILSIVPQTANSKADDHNFFGRVGLCVCLCVCMYVHMYVYITFQRQTQLIITYAYSNL
jgi:hypothetical protein